MSGHIYYSLNKWLSLSFSGDRFIVFQFLGFYGEIQDNEAVYPVVSRYDYEKMFYFI